jgi:hypothetical protein
MDIAAKPKDFNMTKIVEDYRRYRLGMIGRAFQCVGQKGVYRVTDIRINGFRDALTDLYTRDANYVVYAVIQKINCPDTYTVPVDDLMPIENPLIKELVE